MQQAANNLITSQTASTVGNTESFITQLVSAANALSSNAFAADLPVIGQVANGVQYIERSAQDAAAQLQQLQAEFENAYCTPAVYTPPVWVPANLTGKRCMLIVMPLPCQWPFAVHAGMMLS